jgi:ribose transport system substrate-binding protein
VKKLGLRGKLVALTALAALALVLAACGGGGGSTDSTSGATESTDSSQPTSSGGAGEEFKLGYVPINLEQPDFIDFVKRFEEIGSEEGFSVVSADAKNDPLTQLHIIQTWLDTGAVDAMVVLPVDPTALEPALKQAESEEIPVVVQGEGAPGGPLQINTTTDWHHYGEQAGEALADCIEKRLGGEAEIAILEGPDLPGEIVKGRIEGEKEALDAAGFSSSIVAEANGEGARQPSLDAMSTVLRAHPDVNAVTGTNDDSMLGAVKAFEAAGTDPKSVCIVGLDAEPEGLAAVKDGTFYATVSLNLEELVEKAAAAVTSLVRDPKSPYRGGAIENETKLITTEKP